MTTYRGRRAASIENGTLRVTVLAGGGHVAEICDLATGVNPLWTPPWASIEPDTCDAARHPEYGRNAESSLLAGIMGHNLCLDIFGGPSAEEAAAGLPVHGETGVTRFDVNVAGGVIQMHGVLPASQLRVERRLELADRTVHFTESVENMTAADRPIGWTQHVTLGPPFLDDGLRMDLPADRSLVHAGEVGPADYLAPGAEFTWPHAPRRGGGRIDLRDYPGGGTSSAYTAQRLDPTRDEAWFMTFSPAARMAFGYAWRRRDFPWIGRWEENRARTTPPWNGETRTLGLEFGASPVPESRRAMIERGRTFDTPGFCWVPAKSRVEVRYRALLRPAEALPAPGGW